MSNDDNSGRDDGSDTAHAAHTRIDGTHAHAKGHADAGAALVESRGRLAAVLAITVSVLAIEVIGGLLSGSLALLADAGHMLTDVAGVIIGLIAATLAKRPATPERTWGYYRAEIIGAAAQAGLLLAVGIFVCIEAVKRLIAPPEVLSGSMVLFGAVGLAGNILGLLLLTRGRSASSSSGRSSSHAPHSHLPHSHFSSSPHSTQPLHIRAVFLELISDALGSVVVLIAAATIHFVGWTRADAVATLCIALLIIPRTLRLLHESISVLLESTPKGVQLVAVRSRLLKIPHVHNVHDLHASQIATGVPSLSAHIVVDDTCFYDGHLGALLDEVQACIRREFAIDHTTIQFESLQHCDHEHFTHE